MTQAVVSTNPLAASHDPANFRDPLLSKPERWLENPAMNVSDVS